MKYFNHFFYLILLANLFFGCAYEKRKRENFVQIIGVYKLDIKRTELGVYTKNSKIFSDLSITFKNDSTFAMNMRTPFFADSSGTWIVGDGSAYSYNQFFYNNKEYKNLEGVQFFSPYLNGSDTIFLINGANPAKNKKGIQKIYFKKLNQK